MSRFGDWWRQRLGDGSTLRRVLDEDVPGGASFSFTLGSATLLTFFTLGVTGMWQALYYVPDAIHAYDSLNFLRFNVPFGWVVHGTHYWAANVMVVLVVLHLAQVFVWGAYKRPRELTWILGVLLLLATLAAVFTGGPLAWDEKGYWAARVGGGIVGSIPLVGEGLRRILFGGDAVGQVALSRLFGLHVAIIPVIIVGIIGLHLVAFRRPGPAGSFESIQKKAGRFWPDQILMDFLVFLAVLTLIVVLSATLLTPVTGPADPIDPMYPARPDWPFLWVFQLLKYVPGGLEPLATVVLPLVGIAILIAVPWLDRGPQRNPARRPLAMALFLVVVVAILSLGIAGAAPPAPPRAQAPPGPTPSSAIVPPQLPGLDTAPHTIGGADHGAIIFISFCQECHGLLGKDNVPNPGSDDGTVPELNPMDPEIKSSDPQKFVDNIDTFLQNGSVPPGPSPKYKMPAFGNTFSLTQQQIADVESYVLSLNGVERAKITNPGVSPMPFMYFTLGGFVIVLVVSVVALVRLRREA